MALAAFVCAALCLTIGFLRQPRLYPVDYGQYELILRQCGLTWTQEDMALGELQYVRPITVFAWTHFSWSNLLAPNSMTGIVYLVSLIRMVFRPLGLPFSVDALAVLSAALLCLGFVFLALALRRLLPRAWYVAPVLLCFVFMDGNFCAIFRGLYPEGPAIVFSLLFVSLALYAFSLPRQRRVKWLFPVIIASFLALKAFTGLIVFLPAVLAADLTLLFSCREKLLKRLSAAALLLIFLVTGCGSALRQAARDPDYFSAASVYESVFNTMLPAAEDPAGILSEFGLDESYARDIGKSFYEPGETFAHNPRDEQEAEKLFALATPWKTVRTYLSHPDLLAKAINDIPARLSRGFENSRNMQLTAEKKGFSASRTDGGTASFLWRLLPHSYTLFLAGQGFFCLLGIALGARRSRKYLLLSIFSLCAAAYLPFSVILDGYGQAQQYVLIQTVLDLALAAQFLTLVLCAVPLIAEWITQYTTDPFLAPAAASLPLGEGTALARAEAFLARCFNQLAGSRRRVVLATAVAAGVLLAMTFLPAAHPVSINNGDYGRMMAQMDLTWSSHEVYDFNSQAGRKAIEEYQFLHPFNFRKLTFLEPTYSLYLFSSIVRLITEPFGLSFSTLLLAWVMGLISMACILILVHSLYPILKEWTALLSAVLCAMLFSETYLVWYNSLYGEGCVMIGLLMTLACSVRLCVMPEKTGWKKYLYLSGLFVSLWVLCCGKSQMLLAVPGALALLIVFWVYRRPFRYDRQAVHGAVCLVLCAMLAVTSVGVYLSDRNEDSVSQKHTMWQAYFYGIFMIADDPIQEMERLGVDTAMAPDIGKFVSFSEDADYVYAPLSPEAQEAFYDHVSTGTILAWYLTHPGKLLLMLNHAAGESRELYTGFRVYNGQDYSDLSHDAVDGRNLWPGWRSALAPGFFLGYVILYGALLAYLIWRITRKGASAQARLMCCIALFLLITGVLQFPMSVLGNGFADNQKQLFCFALCHDLLTAGAVTLGARYLSGISLRPEKLRESMRRFRLPLRLNGKNAGRNPE